MSVKHKVYLSRIGLIYLFVPVIVLTGAILREINILVLLGGMMTWPLIFSWSAVTGAIRGLKVLRKMPDSVAAGDPVVVDITVRNGRKWGTSRAIVVHDAITRDSSDKKRPLLNPGVLFTHVRAGETATLSYRGVLPQRGKYRFGPLKVTTEYPLGFIRGVLSTDQNEPLLVYPRLGRLTSTWSELHREEVLGSRRTPRQAGLVEGDFFGLRDWRPGDSRRWIHWRTSARRSRLSVRQFDQPRNQDLALLLDLWQPERPETVHRDNVELAISFAATVVRDLCTRGGSHVVLAVGGADVETAKGPASRAFLREALELLAVREAGPQADLVELFRAMLPMVHAGMRSMLVSTRPINRDQVRAMWREHPRRATVKASDVLCIDVSAGQLDPYFRVE